MKKTLLFFLIIITHPTKANELLASFRLINGVFTYDSNSISGSTTTYGSPGLQIHTPLNNKNLIGFNLEVHINASTQMTSLYAIGANYRYYFHGIGTHTAYKVDGIELRTKTNWSSYLNTTFNKYSYYLGSNQVNEKRFTQNGDFFNLDMGIGTEYDYTKGYRIFTDINYTLLSLASSDDRIKLRGTFITIGITKEFM